MPEWIAQCEATLGNGYERALRPNVSWFVAVMDGAIHAGELLLRLRKRNAVAQTSEDGEMAVRIRVGE